MNDVVPQSVFSLHIHAIVSITLNFPFAPSLSRFHDEHVNFCFGCGALDTFHFCFVFEPSPFSFEKLLQMTLTSERNLKLSASSDFNIFLLLRKLIISFTSTIIQQPFIKSFVVRQKSRSVCDIYEQRQRLISSRKVHAIDYANKGFASGKHSALIFNASGQFQPLNET